ncbi:unnamed protein product [Prorocentrum cordatum]|uniref:Uncharacterized protein n=1 Tax=Prorocentrum cordatum TaxID=2364126 RepID=A0ABN9Q763_9DINO|nr:unnamed protein product [Polarella glacialis]
MPRGTSAAAALLSRPAPAWGGEAAHESEAVCWAAPRAPRGGRGPAGASCFLGEERRADDKRAALESSLKSGNPFMCYPDPAMGPGPKGGTPFRCFSMVMLQSPAGPASWSENDLEQAGGGLGATIGAAAAGEPRHVALLGSPPLPMHDRARPRAGGPPGGAAFL